MQVSKDSTEYLITKGKCQERWRKVKVDTLFSQSCLRFEHYIAGTSSDYISQYHALRVLLALSGIGLLRWESGLSVMLENIFGKRLVLKLSSVLLMEANFNAANKIIFRERMLQNARKYRLRPDLIFRQRNRMANNSALTKVLFYDIAQQLMIVTAIASVD